MTTPKLIIPDLDGLVESSTPTASIASRTIRATRVREVSRCTYQRLHMAGTPTEYELKQWALDIGRIYQTAQMELLAIGVPLESSDYLTLDFLELKASAINILLESAARYRKAELNTERLAKKQRVKEEQQHQSPKLSQ